jgi:hypothetical protein
MIRKSGPRFSDKIMLNEMEENVSNDPVVAIVGVTGAVGAEFIATMDKRGFRVGKLKALASARSAGKTVSFRGQNVVIEELTSAPSTASTSRCSRPAAASPRSTRRSQSRPAPSWSTTPPPSAWIRTCRS